MGDHFESVGRKCCLEMFPQIILALVQDKSPTLIHLTGLLTIYVTRIVLRHAASYEVYYGDVCWLLLVPAGFATKETLWLFLLFL